MPEKRPITDQTRSWSLRGDDLQKKTNKQKNTFVIRGRGLKGAQEEGNTLFILARRTYCERGPHPIVQIKFIPYKTDHDVPCQKHTILPNQSNLAIAISRFNVKLVVKTRTIPGNLLGTELYSLILYSNYQQCFLVHKQFCSSYTCYKTIRQNLKPSKKTNN